MGMTKIRGEQIKDDSVTGDDVDESTLILDTLRDADGDTKIQLEESADEDKIRFDTSGIERLKINSDGGFGFGNGSVPGAAGTWNYYNFKGGGVRAQAASIFLDNNRSLNWGDSSVKIKGNATTEVLEIKANNTTYFYLDGTNGNTGIGTSSPSRKIDILDASNPQLRLTHTDGSKYVDLKATSAGDIEITGSSIDTDHSYLKFIAAGNASMVIQSQAADGDAQLGFSVDAGSSLAFSAGVDDGDGDKFKIGTSTIDTNTRLTITSTGDVGIGENSPTSKFEINGSFATKVTSKTADYTLSATDHTVLIDANSADRTLTLPAASTSVGRIYVIKRTDQGIDTVTITRSGSDTIDGQATVTVNGGDSITLQSAGNNSWIIIGEYKAPV